MNYEYDLLRLKKEYEDERKMTKKYGIQISERMIKFLNIVKACNDAYDLKCFTFLFMEHKKGNLKEYYSISLDKKRSKWRVLIQMLDEKGNVLIPSSNEKEFLKSIKRIRIKEMSEHYGEY